MMQHIELGNYLTNINTTKSNKVVKSLKSCLMLQQASGLLAILILAMLEVTSMSSEEALVFNRGTSTRA